MIWRKACLIWGWRDRFTQFQGVDLDIDGEIGVERKGEMSLTPEISRKEGRLLCSGSTHRKVIGANIVGRKELRHWFPIGKVNFF
jgi:hypothetical protein